MLYLVLYQITLLYNIYIILPLFKYINKTLPTDNDNTVLSPSATTHGLISVISGGIPE